MAMNPQTPTRFAPGRTAASPVAPLALYVHIPFCGSRCHYCDFNTYAGMDGWMADYVDALQQEAGQLARSAEFRPALGSVYFGGGTPSRLSPSDLTDLLGAIEQGFALESDAELSLEANPGELSLAFLETAHSLGFNRISLGMQAADDPDLRSLGRRHSHSETVDAVHHSRAAGFANLSLDLIAGVPGRRLPAWQATVEKALALEPDHLSVYALSVEPGTPLEAQIARRRVASPDDDVIADMLDWLDDRLAAAGMAQYEISNWAHGAPSTRAQPSFACRHNLTYWRNQPYLALGAGAHGYASAVRTANVRPIPEYVRRVRGTAAAPRYPISSAAETWRDVGEDEAARDTMLLGLRLTQTGVHRPDFTARHGPDAWELMWASAGRHLEAGLLEWLDSEECLRLTARGRRLGNRVFQAFV